MNVLHASFCYYQSTGGLDRYLRALCDGLDEAGHKTVFLYSREILSRKQARPEYFLEGYTDFPPRPNVDFSRLDEILRKESIEIAHLHGVWNPWIISWLAERVPILQTEHEHGLHCPSGSKYFRFTRRRCTHPYGLRCIADAFLQGCNSRRPSKLWNSYRRVSATRSVKECVSRFLVVSHFMKQCLLQHGYPCEKIFVLPYFTEFADYPLPPGNLQNGRPMVLFAGRFVPEKGWFEFLLSLKKLDRPFQALMAGDGPDMPSARALCGRLGLNDRVRFTGWLPSKEMVEAYLRSAVVVVPSVWPEPLGSVGLEAMSFAKPVVSFNVGGVSEWLEDGVTGFLVDAGNVDQMSNRISHLLGNALLAHQFGWAGKVCVQARFQKSAHISAMSKHYSQCLQSPRASSLEKNGR